MECDFGNVGRPAILTPLIILTKSAHFFINFWQIEIMKSLRICKFPIGKYLNLAIRPLFLFSSRFRPVFSWTILVPNFETIPLRGLWKSEIHSDHYFSRFFKFFTNIQIFVFLTFLRISGFSYWDFSGSALEVTILDPLRNPCALFQVFLRPVFLIKFRDFP